MTSVTLRSAMPTLTPTMTWLPSRSKARIQRIDQALCQHLGIRKLPCANLHDGEFVAAQPCQCVGLANTGAQPAGHADQQPVAGGVPQCVVHLLEAVQIEVEHGQRRTLAPRPCHGLLEPITKQSAVGQSGQRVMRCEMRRSCQRTTQQPQWPGAQHSEGDCPEGTGQHRYEAVMTSSPCSERCISTFPMTAPESYTGLTAAMTGCGSSVALCGDLLPGSGDDDPALGLRQRAKHGEQAANPGILEHPQFGVAAGKLRDRGRGKLALGGDLGMPGRISGQEIRGGKHHADGERDRRRKCRDNPRDSRVEVRNFVGSCASAGEWYVAEPHQQFAGLPGSTGRRGTERLPRSAGCARRHTECAPVCSVCRPVPRPSAVRHPA